MSNLYKNIYKNINEIKNHEYDVIVVGGGHAGIEAAYASCKMGSKTLLITLDINKIGLMPCNPAIGGVGKGHIVYEISALGGLMPKICSKTYLQARMLNTKKGPAVQGLRLQIDKFAYNDLCVKTLSNLPNLTILECMVTGLLHDTKITDVENNICNEIKAGVVTGVETECGQKFYAKSVILTTGTFLNGVVHVGTKNHKAGRFGEKSVPKLTDSLKNLGLKVGRLKTGTPPRLLSSSLDWSKMEVQETEQLNYLFELEKIDVKNSHNCCITHTTEKTHEIIRENIKLSAMYSGNITGIGPRYCPSIEDKVSRFPTKTSHHIFVEPEGANSNEIYPNGISTSLPEHIQELYIKSIPGFENAIITRYGYAIEYDFVFPEQLKHSLETKNIKGLFLAGQINGTTGYEEAAAQGAIAGINAHLHASNKEEFILDRNESYIGVMIDDLTSMGVDEPYRMFTSRAERRLLLRQDNVFLRLMPKANKLGLIEPEIYEKFEDEKRELELVLGTLKTNYKHAQLIDIFDKITQETELEPKLENKLLDKITKETELTTKLENTPKENKYNINTQENINNQEKTDSQKLQEIINTLTEHKISERNALTIYAEIRYGPYLEREELEIKKREKFKELEIPTDFDYKNMPGLSIELQQKLTKFKPKTIAQAELIPGITPAAISLLIFKTRQFDRTLI